MAALRILEEISDRARRSDYSTDLIMYWGFSNWHAFKTAVCKPRGRCYLLLRPHEKVELARSWRIYRLSVGTQERSEQRTHLPAETVEASTRPVASIAPI